MLLAILAVIVFAGAVYVIGENDTPASDSASQTSATTSGSTPLAPSTSTRTSSIPTPTASRRTTAKPVVVFLGDDWTSGVGASQKSKRFSRLVCDQIGATQRNLGKSGTGYTTGSKDSYADRVDEIVAAKPDVVVVSGGRNDLIQNDFKIDAGTVRSRADALFTALLKKLPDARLVAVAPMWGDSDAPAVVGQLGALIDKAVTRVGGTYLDIADPIHDHPEFMADNAHPNDAGYRAIADALAPKLTPLLPN